MAGVPDADAPMAKRGDYTLAGVADRITCPFPVVHGAHDAIVPVGSKNKTLRIFTAEEGGAGHCQGNTRVLGAKFVADWLADNL